MQELKTLRQKLAQLEIRPDRLITAIDCALMNTHEPITKDWLREELDRYLRRMQEK